MVVDKPEVGDLSLVLQRFHKCETPPAMEQGHVCTVLAECSVKLWCVPVFLLT